MGVICVNSSIGVLIAFLATMACDVRGAELQAVADSNVDKRDVRGKTVQSERDEQEALFNYYFRQQKLKYETRLKELKESASVPNWRIPYSADIHPQAAGGLGDIGSRGRRSRYGGSSSLSVYDRAFNDGRDLANSYEVQRVLGSDSAFLRRTEIATQQRRLGRLLQRLHGLDDPTSRAHKARGRGPSRRHCRRRLSAFGH